jgi:hypothetical protein
MVGRKGAVDSSMLNSPELLFGLPYIINRPPRGFGQEVHH